MFELFTYDFMQRSLLAAAMVGGLCSVIGVFVVLRGLAFVGAGTSHAAFAGVALGYLMGWPPLGLVGKLPHLQQEMLSWLLMWQLWRLRTAAVMADCRG